jgi:hypothetical protein
MTNITEFTSDINEFAEQLNNPNKHISKASNNPSIVHDSEIVKVDKNLILSISSDATGCGHIRNIFPLTYLNAVFGKSRLLRTSVIPFFCYQHEVLMQVRTLFFPRIMDNKAVKAIKRYKEVQDRYKYKMVYDIDDFIWKGDDQGEGIPDYNFSSRKISDEAIENVNVIMSMMDLITVSTDFLKDYIINKLKIKKEIVVLKNCVPKYFYGPNMKPPITEKIKKPLFIYGGSPTHYNNEHSLKGDFNNAWSEFIVKNVKYDKIDFIIMGCTPNPRDRNKFDIPFFFEEIRNKITLIPWQNSYQFHLPILAYKPDFWIAPLVKNYFNYSKSDISYITAAACGAAFMGTTFTNDKPSPYDNCEIKIKDDIKLDDLEGLIFNDLVYPTFYNKIIKNQWEMLEKDGRWLESKKYINQLTKVF